MEDISHRIHDAAKKGSIEDVARLLKDYPELVNDKGEDGWTPMFRACYNNRLELARFLAENGANLGRDADDFQNTPLHACCINGHREVAEYLISKGVPVNEYDNVGGWSPLYAAAFFGWPDLVRLLMAHGADPSIACKEGKRPIDVVCEAGYRAEHRAVIEALLQNRPEPALPTRPGRGRSSLTLTNTSSRRRVPGDGAGGMMAAGASAGAGGSPAELLAPLSGPPNFTVDVNGTRVYFPWELAHTDYVLRGLELAREALHRLFKGALAAGKVDEIPGSRCIYRPQPDAFKLIEVALSGKNEAPLEAFLAEAAAAAAGKGEEGAKAAAPAVPLRERLEGIVASAAVPYKGSVSREEVDYMLTEIHALAESVPNAQDVADDARFLVEQFHAHADSKSLRLRLLRVQQIRGTLDHPAGTAAAPPRASSGSGASAASAGADASSSGSAGGGGLGVSGGFSPVVRGTEVVEGKRGDFKSQYQFVKENVGDLVLSDDH